ncbi:MAG: alpha-L-fucosidase [Acidobacteria bacterium]|nr:alpha-L-fucosidase [Acidobacteriota bacterium]
MYDSRMTRREFTRLAAVGPLRFGDGRDWFFQRRFGLFVHWGLYSIRGYHEQELYRKRLKREEYEPLMRQFDPVKYRPAEWLDVMEQVGMQYVCFTTKHIDGFCMWDSAETDYKVTRTPYGRDVLKMLADECRRRDVPLCLYYSVVDEHQKNYPHSGRPYELAGPQAGDEPDLAAYLEYVRRQVRELCTGYGKVSGIWWDANVLQVRDASMRAMIRALQPSAVINNRGFDDGDFGTPERDYDRGIEGVSVFPKPTEACESVGSQSWGFRKDEDYYSASYLKRSIQKTMAKGGNYLLNAGPKADGTLPEKAVNVLGEVGRWYKAVEEGLTAEPAGRLTQDARLLFTRRNKTVYLHITAEFESEAILLRPMAERPLKATLLNTGKELEAEVAALPKLWNQTPDRCLRLRGVPEGMAGAVVKLEF